MSGKKVVVVAYDIASSYGWGVRPCMDGLFSGVSSIGKISRFPTDRFLTDKAATVPGIDGAQDKTLVMQMLEPLFKKASFAMPEGTLPILATINGEIDLMERHVFTGKPEADKSCFGYLLDKVKTLSGTTEPGLIISTACSSSTMAIAQAAAMISGGEHDSILVVACDCISEFLFAGFSTIMALDKEIARPFDKDMNGLTIGEAAGYMLLMSAERARREKRHASAEVVGWGSSSDANHMTSPSRDGAGLASAIVKVLKIAGIENSKIGGIVAHGTGTPYNDSMEMRAFKRIFGTSAAIPTFSVKGGIGHTMGAAGLVEAVVAIESLHAKAVPGTINLRTVDHEAEGWVSAKTRPLKYATMLSTNSGFGGVNGALILREC